MTTDPRTGPQGTAAHPAARVALGRSGVTVSRLGLGTAPFGGLYTSVADHDAHATVAAAVQVGCTYVDTAPLYGHGVAEERVGAALRALPAAARAGVTLSTKVGRLVVPTPPEQADTWQFRDAPPSRAVFDYSRDGVLRSLEASLGRLGVDRVDVVVVHDPDDHEDQALTEAFPALADLRAQGVIGAVGVGMNQPRIPLRFVRETDVDVVLLAGRWTLLDHTGAELYAEAAARGVAVVVGGVFNSGVLVAPSAAATFDYEPVPAHLLERALAVQAVCGRHGVPLPAAALRFPLGQPAVASVLVGARSAAEITQNAAWFAHPVPDDCWRELVHEGLLPADAPLPLAGAW